MSSSKIDGNGLIHSVGCQILLKSKRKGLLDLTPAHLCQIASPSSSAGEATLSGVKNERTHQA